MLQLKSHRLDAAMASFRKALAIAPDTAEAHNDAMGHYRQALALKPDYAEAHNNLGTAFKMVGRVDEALQSIETAIRLAPTTVEFLLNLSEVKRFTEDAPHLAAMEELARAGRRNPPKGRRSSISPSARPLLISKSTSSRSATCSPVMP